MLYSLLVWLITAIKKIKKYLSTSWPILLLAGLLLMVFWPYLQGGVFEAEGQIYSDLWLFNYPLKDWYSFLLSKNKLPFWTSLIGNGYPVLAELQIGGLYPWHLLLFKFVSMPVAYNLNIFSHFLLAAVATFAFLRKAVGVSKEAALVSGIIFSLSGFMVIHLHQTNFISAVSYLPLQLLIADQIVKKRKWVWVFAMALTICLQLLIGQVEIFYYSFLVTVFYIGSLVLIFPHSLKTKKELKKDKLIVCDSDFTGNWQQFNAIAAHL